MIILHFFNNHRPRATAKPAAQLGVLSNAISRVTLCERREGSFVSTGMVAGSVRCVRERPSESGWSPCFKGSSIGSLSLSIKGVTSNARCYNGTSVPWTYN